MVKRVHEIYAVPRQYAPGPLRGMGRKTAGVDHRRRVGTFDRAIGDLQFGVFLRRAAEMDGRPLRQPTAVCWNDSPVQQIDRGRERP